MLLPACGERSSSEPQAGAGAPAAAAFEFSKLAMGTRARIVLHGPSEPEAAVAAAAAFDLIERYEQALSDYRASGESVTLVARPAGEWHDVSPELADAFVLAQGLAAATGGAFDVTIGPLTQLWRASRDAGGLPDAGSLRAARGVVGFELIELDGARVKLGKPGMRLDFGGIGKGLAAQRAVELLRASGFPSALVQIGGDTVAGDPPPGKPGWFISVRTGLGGGADGGPTQTLSIANRAVSTSGDAEQFVEIDGVRYAHIVDPATGLGLTARRAATVVAGDGATADALATALCVTGERLPTEVAAELGVVSARVLGEPGTGWTRTPTGAAAASGPAAGTTRTVRVPGTTVEFTVAWVPGGEVSLPDGRVVASPDLWVATTETTWDLYDIYLYALDIPTGGTDIDGVTRPSRPYIPPDRGLGHAGHASLGMTLQGAEKFCEWLSVKVGERVRLPSREEWLSVVVRGLGEEVSPRDETTRHMGNSDFVPHAVGSKRADGFGLYDTLGNVSEWVLTGEKPPSAMGGSYLDEVENCFPWSEQRYSVSWQVTDPQIPKSRWWMSDCGWVGFRFVMEP